MKILVNNAGKRFNRDWIFRNLQLELSSPNHYAITGHNGSGKSTFLQCIAGSLHLNEGAIELQHATGHIEKENAYQYLSLAAPYLELIEEMTAIHRFKKSSPHTDPRLFQRYETAGKAGPSFFLGYPASAFG
jgi:ATPase subunit of ABC transporter with duplicated ATPase domains